MRGGRFATISPKEFLQIPLSYLTPGPPIRTILSKLIRAISPRSPSLEQPLSIALNRDGSLLAVSYDPNGAGKTTPLAFYRFSGGKLSSPVIPQIPGWTAGEKLIDVEWSPRENLLVLLNVTRAELSLVRVTEADGKINLAGATGSVWKKTVSSPVSPRTGTPS